MPVNGPRQHYARAMLERDATGDQIVRPVRSQDSSLMAPLAMADALIVQPPNTLPAPQAHPSRSCFSISDPRRGD